MKKKVFLDSGIFIALFLSSDRWHQEAKALFSVPSKYWSTSLLVVSESYSWFLHKLGEEPARKFSSFLRELPNLELFEATTKHHRAVQRTLDKFRGTKLTYVDASSLTFLAEHKISTVWSTDHHLGLSGAHVLPGR
ncbi:MAG: type II toxin-antitoxin system VapC family toxin [Deltaproteobacteria bacterium]|nr:type II toxin-antitoxin system VapC family toxin [Deltaproteobacteria bacterium]